MKTLERVLYVLWLVALVTLCVTFFKGSEIMPAWIYWGCWIYAAIHVIWKMKNALERSGRFFRAILTHIIPVIIMAVLGMVCWIF